MSLSCLGNIIYNVLPSTVRVDVYYTCMYVYVLQFPQLLRSSETLMCCVFYVEAESPASALPASDMGEEGRGRMVVSQHVPPRWRR